MGVVEIFILAVGGLVFGYSLRDLYKRYKNRKNKQKDEE